jgi:hypothetical protein
MRRRGVIRWAWAAAVAAVLASAGPAPAFYWYGWPGSRVPPRKTIVGPPGAPENPPVFPPLMPPVNSPPELPPTPPGPVPEPGTALAALAGLGALAAARMWRGRRR